MKKEMQLEMSNINITYVDVNLAKTSKPCEEICDSTTVTEQSGYIDPKRQIEDMIIAGRRLDDFRKSQYDFDDEDSIDESLSDPTRGGNFDLADASQMSYDANQRINEARKDYVKRSQDVQDRSGEGENGKEGVSEPPPGKGA